MSTSLVSQLFTTCSDVFYTESSDGTSVPICEIYSSVTDEAVKNRVLSSFTDPNGLVRIVVATIAFGLGINAPDVRYIVNWGPVLKPTYKKQEEMAWMLKQHYTTIKLMLPWSQMT